MRPGAVTLAVPLLPQLGVPLLPIVLAADMGDGGEPGTARTTANRPRVRFTRYTGLRLPVDSDDHQRARTPLRLPEPQHDCKRVEARVIVVTAPETPGNLTQWTPRRGQRCPRRRHTPPSPISAARSWPRRRGSGPEPPTTAKPSPRGCGLEARLRGQHHGQQGDGPLGTPRPTRRTSHDRPTDRVGEPHLHRGQRDFSAVTSAVSDAFASPNSSVVFGSKSSSFSMPANPGRIERLRKTMAPAWSASRIGMP